MAIKNFLLALLPLACGESVFDKTMRNSGANTFFERFFQNIEPAPNGKCNCAFFDMDGTIISAALISPVFAYQVRKSKFAFTSNSVDEVFGFMTASDQCRPKGQLPMKFGNQEIVVVFETVVFEIKNIFDAREQSENNARYLGGLIAVWDKFAFSYMQHQDRKSKCDYLSTTIRYRLLHGINTKDREKLMLAVLKEEPKRGMYDDYMYDDVVVSIRTNIPALYEEQKVLINELTARKVKSFVISTTPKEYLDTLITYFNIGINSAHANGSYPILKHHKTMEAAVLAGSGHSNHESGKVDTMKWIAKEYGCIFLYASGDSMGDYEMVHEVLEHKGYALIQQGLPLDKNLLDLAKEKSYEGRVRIQNVNLEEAKWQKVV
uniref:AlNc14C1222G12839 protein n=1 Tax=Albugo laibachii Nc14 TaxID=890382 RepID=F0X2K8_9STRA|nr:AlNc14C1222G12839 [Albugo laibachii Nc14]|eukprot:CCA28120.1 AlNc14C1222G12839 [Albugo laibachii Nc14]